MAYERSRQAHPYWLSTIQEFLLPDVALADVPHSAGELLTAVLEAIRNGDLATAIVHAEALLCIPLGSPAKAVAHAARALCFTKNGRHAEASASLRKALESLPDDARLTYSLGLTLLRQHEIAAAVDCFRQAVASNPGLGQAWAAIALIACLEQDHAATEVAAREALRLGCALPGRLVELALMQATRLQGKTVEGAFDFSTLTLTDDEIDTRLKQLLATMPPVDQTTLVHPPHGRPVYFVYADHLYFIEHVIPLVLSIVETGARCAIHLHIANPGRGAVDLIERLRARLKDTPLIVSTESVFVEQYAAPSVYHSCMRFVRLWQAFRANNMPMVMVDADVLARRDPSVLEEDIDPAIDVVLARSETDPYWSWFYGGYVSLRPRPGAGRFIGMVAAFILQNFAQRTARWFLDQTALAACHDAESARVTFNCLPWAPLFGGLEFTDRQVFWTAHNEDKYGDNPHTRLKESLRLQNGFPRAINDEVYRPQVISTVSGQLLVNAGKEPPGTVGGHAVGTGQREVELLAGFLRPGHTIVDAGASFGIVTIALARAVGPHGRVYAVEPDRLECQTLAANLALTGATNVFLVQGSPAVDELPLDACHLIRIGGEGDRVTALRGCAQTVARHRPWVYVADAGNGSHFALKDLREAGYTLYVHVIESVSVGILALPKEARVDVNGMARLDA